MKDGGVPPYSAVLLVDEAHKFCKDWDGHFLGLCIVHKGLCVMARCVRKECGLSFATISWLQSGVVKPASHCRLKMQHPRRRGVATLAWSPCPPPERDHVILFFCPSLFLFFFWSLSGYPPCGPHESNFHRIKHQISFGPTLFPSPAFP